MEHPPFAELLQEHLQSMSRVDDYVTSKKSHIPVRTTAVLHPISAFAEHLQLMNMLKPSRLVAADYLALQFLHLFGTETANKTAVNNPELVIDQRFSQLIQNTRPSGEENHYCSLTGTNVKSVGTHSTLKSMRITPPRSHEPSLLPTSNIVCGSCDHNGGTITSEDGIKLTIPEGAIKDGDLVTFHITTGLFGPFVLSSKCQSDVVSPYYWIEVSGSYHFQKPIQVEFEHFAVISACDPSHYQLLCCEDDDELYTMQPVDYELSFRVQGDISLCTFQTQHFYVNCLFHNHKEPVINQIGAYFLKPSDSQYLDHFTVEVWFSFPYCVQRNEELYTKKGMVLDLSYIFEVSSDKSSTNYFTLSYDQNINSWHLDHTPLIIETKKVNFHNYYTDKEKLKLHEELSLFPPRFIVNIRKTERRHAPNLHLNMVVTLCNSTEERKPLQAASVTLNLLSAQPTTADAVEDLTKENSFSISHNCKENTAKLADLVKYSQKIEHCWQEIAFQMDIHKQEIDRIDPHHLCIQDKCCVMFTAWLKRTTSPCWCKFVQALYAVGLESIAEEAKMHLTLVESADIITDEGISKVIEFYNIHVCS